MPQISVNPEKGNALSEPFPTVLSTLRQVEKYLSIAEVQLLLFGLDFPYCLVVSVIASSGTD